MTISTNWQLRQIDKRTNWQVFLLFFLKQFFLRIFFLILFFDNVDKLTIFFLTIDNYCQFRQIDKLTISINWHDFFFSFSIFFLRLKLFKINFYISLFASIDRFDLVCRLINSGFTQWVNCPGAVLNPSFFILNDINVLQLL